MEGKQTNESLKRLPTETLVEFTLRYCEAKLPEYFASRADAAQMAQAIAELDPFQR